MPTLYRIKDWEIHFENNRTRELKKMVWIPLPNKLDGDGYTELVDHPEGPLHYAAWIVLVQVASKCVPRGTLIRDTGRPHDSGSLSRISRMPRSVFDGSIPRLLEIEWLERLVLDEQALTKISQSGARIPQSPAAYGDGTEGHGTEEQNTIPVPVPDARDAASVPSSGRSVAGSVPGTVAESEVDWEAIPELSDSRHRMLTPDEPGALVRSAFRCLKSSHLSDARAMAAWHRKALGCQRPVVGGSEAHLRLTVAAALHAKAVPDEEVKKNRVALFSSIIKHQQWQKVAYKLPEAVKALSEVEHG